MMMAMTASPSSRYSLFEGIVLLRVQLRAPYSHAFDQVLQTNPVPRQRPRDQNAPDEQVRHKRDGRPDGCFKGAFSVGGGCADHSRVNGVGPDTDDDQGKN